MAIALGESPAYCELNNEFVAGQNWFSVPPAEALPVMRNLDTPHALGPWRVDSDGVSVKASRLSDQILAAEKLRKLWDLSAIHPRLPKPSCLWPIRDGWLVGYDGGEFGSSLWFLSDDGKTKKQISTDRVIQFVEADSRLFAVEGLEHAGISIGSVIELSKSQPSGAWKVKTICEFEFATPFAVVPAAPGRLLVFTRFVAYHVGYDGKVEEAGLENLIERLPESLQTGALLDGHFYFGSDLFVVKADPDGEGLDYLFPSKNAWDAVVAEIP